MNYKEVRVKKGQIWVDKQNGELFIIKGGKGNEFWGERGSGKNVSHHITRFNLIKRFILKEV